MAFDSETGYDELSGLLSRNMPRLPDPPPEIRLRPWHYPYVDATGVVELESYSADIMVGKRLRHLRPPVARDYEGHRYVVVIDNSEVIAVYRVIARRPWTLERLLTWPFDGDDASLV